MWKRRLVAAVLTLALLAFLGGLGYLGFRYYQRNYLYLDGRHIRRDSQSLDLSGNILPDIDKIQELQELKLLDLRRPGLTVEQYRCLQSALPECRILWELPFQGRRYDLDTRELTVSSLSQEESELLDYLPELQTLHAEACRDYPVLIAFQLRRPAVHVIYNVTLAGQQISNADSAITAADVSAQALDQAIADLPAISAVHLTGVLPTPEELAALQEKYPGIRFTWEVTLGSLVLPMDTTQADLSGENLTALELERLPEYLPALTAMNLTDTGLTQETKVNFAKNHPDIHCRFGLTVADVPLSTEDREIDLSGHTLDSLKELESLLPCFPNLEKLVLCGCGIDSETLDDLQNRLDGVRVVWSVDLGGILLRTDATWFMPTKYGLKVTDADIADLKYCRDMVCIDLGHMEITNCDWAAGMDKLQYLVLADSPLSDISGLEGRTSLIYLELFLTRLQDLTPLESCTSLEDINLCYTYCDATPLTKMPWLKRVWWSGNWMARSLLPAALPDAELNFTAASSTGEGWREGKHYYEMRDILGMGYMTG